MGPPGAERLGWFVGAPGGAVPLSPGPTQRDLSALDLQTWTALAGQTQTSQIRIYFGNTLSQKGILGLEWPTGGSRRYLLRAGSQDLGTGSTVHVINSH